MEKTSNKIRPIERQSTLRKFFKLATRANILKFVQQNADWLFIINVSIPSLNV